MPFRSQKIALQYFLQTVGLCFVLSVFFGLLYTTVQSETDSQFIRLGFGFISILTMGVCLSTHAHWLLIKPLHKLEKNLATMDVKALASEDLVIHPSSRLQCEFGEIENLFHELLQKLQYRHREVLLTKNDLARLNRNLEAELELRRQQLESRVGASFQQNKLNALGEMAAGIAHEINNPLAILVGRSEQMRELMTREGTLSIKQDAILKSMEKTMLRIQEAVEDLGLIARGPTHEEVRPIPLSRLVKRLNKIVSNRYQTQEISFDPEIESDLEIEGREVELSQALLYILENASEAAQSSETKWVRIVLKRNEDGSCTLEISDSGTGIEESLRGKLFQPFFTTKDEGRGMGLSLAKGIIDSHSGALNFAFHKDVTTVTIRLPRQQTKDKSSAVA